MRFTLPGRALGRRAIQTRAAGTQFSSNYELIIEDEYRYGYNADFDPLMQGL